MAFAWIFFRAENTKAAIAVIKSIINNMDTNIFSDNQLFTAGLDEANFILLMIAIFILIVFDVLKNKKTGNYKIVRFFVLFIFNITAVVRSVRLRKRRFVLFLHLRTDGNVPDSP